MNEGVLMKHITIRPTQYQVQIAWMPLKMLLRQRSRLVCDGHVMYGNVNCEFV